MINNRQNGRRRGRGGGQRQGGGGGQGQRDSGNRIDSRARGNAAQLLEKYRNMARDAQMSGDRVNTEYYLQFADHYFRVLADQRGRADDQPQQRRPRDDFDQFDLDDDFGDEGEPIRAEEQPRAQESDRGERPRYQGNGRDDAQGRDRGYRDDNRNGAQREARGERGGNRENGRDAQRDGNRDDRRNGDQPRLQHAVPVANDLDDAGTPVAAPEPMTAEATPVAEEAPRRRGRPRKVREPVADEGAEALGADRLPPALGVVSGADAADETAEEAPKPRRRRVRTAEATQAG